MYYFGKRYYDAEIGKWISTDPADYNYDPYLYVNANPIMFTDPDGSVPCQNQLGTSAMVSSMLGTVKLNPSYYDFNRNPYRGDVVKGRYVAIAGGNIVDMQHFLAAAAKANEIGGVAGWLATDAGGLWVEIKQAWNGIFNKNAGLRMSAFSYEDIPSNDFGAMFATMFYDAEKPLGPQVESFLNMLGAMSPADFKKSYESIFNALPKTEAIATEEYTK